jgi:3-phenylpropionate/trans-cinnamate dioxygenase ferredoxin reductase component
MATVIGVTPRTEFADSAAGLRTHNGVLVDDQLRTNLEGIFAAGDVANAWHPHYRRHLRVEHWANAVNQGTTAGRNAAGHSDAYSRLPYFFSDQYDLGMEFVGHAEPDDAVVIRGDTSRREFIAFWHRGGLVTATLNVNVWGVVDDLEAIVAARQPVDLARLADLDVRLRDLVPAPPDVSSTAAA